jgi:multisubunit Na+/H+ antiporter MnhG subunit
VVVAKRNVGVATPIIVVIATYSYVVVAKNIVVIATPIMVVIATPIIVVLMAAATRKNRFLAAKNEVFGNQTKKQAAQEQSKR